jgi:hypothetical protein
MNALFVLMGLLVLSYLGSFLARGRTVRGVGLPSGAEYLVLGVVIGPQVLGVVEPSMLESFAPVVYVALGWFALVLGLDFGFAGEKRVRPGSFFLSLAGTALTGGAAFGAVIAVLRHYPGLAPGVSPWLVAGALAAVSAETTQHAIRWVAERAGARGPMTSLLDELAHGDDAVPLLAMAVLFAFTTETAHIPAHVTPWGWVGITAGLGIVLGALAALLIGVEFSLSATWGVLFGITLLAIGVAARFELSTMATTFFIGVGIATLSPHRPLIREVLAPTERPVLLPALVLAGAHLDLHAFRNSRGLLVLVGVALLARLVGKLFSGLAVYSFTHTARRGSPLVGLGLLSSGALSTACGLALAVRFPGPVGDAALLAAVAAAVIGEIIGPPALRRALTRAGEVDESSPDPSPAPGPASEEAKPASDPASEEAPS